MDKNKGVKLPVQLRVNMWLGLSAHEKKFNSFSEGNFSVYAEMVHSYSCFSKNTYSIHISDFTKAWMECCL